MRQLINIQKIPSTQFSRMINYNWKVNTAQATFQMVQEHLLILQYNLSSTPTPSLSLYQAHTVKRHRHRKPRRHLFQEHPSPILVTPA